ncbi:hypothetical protein CPC197_0822, partial [Chlamydia psittaci C1/97]
MFRVSEFKRTDNI